jgi:hypothetical protein
MVSSKGAMVNLQIQTQNKNFLKVFFIFLEN